MHEGATNSARRADGEARHTVPTPAPAGSRQAAEPKSLSVTHFLLASKNLSLTVAARIERLRREIGRGRQGGERDF